MSKLTRLFRTNSTLETQGVTLDYGDGVKITIARAGGANKRWQRTLEKLTRPVQRAIATETLPEERGAEILRQCVAEAIVIGWEGITVGDVEGTEDEGAAPFTVVNCVKLFTRLPELFLDVRTQSMKVALFRDEVEEGQAKN